MRLRVYLIAGLVALCVPVALAASTRPAGDLDPTFGARGSVFVRVSENSDAADAVLQPDGRVVLAGSVSDRRPPPNSWNGAFLAVRLNENGSLDGSFGERGVVRTRIALGATDAAFASAVALGPGGSVVLAGRAYKSDGNSDLAVVRYTSSGALDTSFSGDGIQTIDVGEADNLHDVAVQSDGKIVAVGYAGLGFLVIRLLSNGALDESFGSGGIVDSNVGDPSYRDSAAGIEVLGDGKLVVAGTADTTYPSYYPAPTDFAVVRYLSDGQRDPTFGEDGIVVTSGPQREGVAGLVSAPDGKIIVVGTQGWPSPGPRYPGTSSFHLARYLPTGALDPTFGTGGVVTTSFSGLPGDTSYPSSVALRLDSKVIAGGNYYGRWPNQEGAGVAVALYRNDGSLDETFGVDGKRTYQIQPPVGVSALGIQRSAARSGADRLVLAGYDFYTRDDHEVAAIGIDLGPPPPPPVRCRVPRVLGLSLGRARARIRSARCRVGRVTRVRSNRRRGRVVSQRPRPGRRLPRGSRVHLVVSRGR
jgi:uncharacterized delta-60 repeat protein